METINAKQLKQAKEKGGLTLINVLPEKSHREEHIPGSINVPLADTPDFAKAVEAKAGGKEAGIVVYCASKDCDASPKAAKKLEEADFKNVRDFEGGIAAWKAAGFTLAGAEKEAAEAAPSGKKG